MNSHGAAIDVAFSPIFLSFFFVFLHVRHVAAYVHTHSFAKSDRTSSRGMFPSTFYAQSCLLSIHTPLASFKSETRQPHDLS